MNRNNLITLNKEMLDAYVSAFKKYFYVEIETHGDIYKKTLAAIHTISKLPDNRQRKDILINFDDPELKKVLDENFVSIATKFGISYDDYKEELEVINKEYGKKIYLDEITKVIFNDPATIVFWRDGSKTLVTCDPDDIFDPEKGLAMACMKKMFDNKGFYNDIFRKWLPEEEEKSLYPKHPDDVLDAMRFSAASVVANSCVFKNAVKQAAREADKIYNKLTYGTEELGKLTDEKEDE